MAENPTDDITFPISMFESVRLLQRIFVLSTCVLSSYIDTNRRYKIPILLFQNVLKVFLTMFEEKNIFV